MALLSTVSALISRRARERGSGGTSVSLGYDRIRFLEPVFAGDTLTARYTILALDPESKEPREGRGVPGRRRARRRGRAPHEVAAAGRMTPLLAGRHVQVRDAVRRFADERIRPVANGLDESERFPAELYTEMAGLGLFGVAIPEALGGAGGDALAYAVVMEELARGYASVADQCGLVELVGTLLAAYGTPEQQERYLRPLLRAERRCAYALTEAEAGSDLSNLRSTATRTADGWTLSGGNSGSTTRRCATSRACSRVPIRRQAIAG